MNYFLCLTGAVTAGDLDQVLWEKKLLRMQGVFGSSHTALGPKSTTSQCRQGNTSLGKNRAVFKENDQCTEVKRGSTCEGSRFVTGRGKE